MSGLPERLARAAALAVADALTVEQYDADDAARATAIIAAAIRAALDAAATVARSHRSAEAPDQDLPAAIAAAIDGLKA